jgi:hypothetical protein
VLLEHNFIVRNEGDTMHIDSSNDPFPRVRDALIEAARDRRLLTYPDVAIIMGLPRSGYDMGRKVGAMADAINRFERDAGRPMLSALLVQTQSRRPGDGFYACAIQLGIVTGFADDASKRAFWEDERDKVYAYWTSSSDQPTTQSPAVKRQPSPEVAQSARPKTLWSRLFAWVSSRL